MKKFTILLSAAILGCLIYEYSLYLFNDESDLVKLLNQFLMWSAVATLLYLALILSKYLDILISRSESSRKG